MSIPPSVVVGWAVSKERPLVQSIFRVVASHFPSISCWCWWWYMTLVSLLSCVCPCMLLLLKLRACLLYDDVSANRLSEDTICRENQIQITCQPHVYSWASFSVLLLEEYDDDLDEDNDLQRLQQSLWRGINTENLCTYVCHDSSNLSMLSHDF